MATEATEPVLLPLTLESRYTAETGTVYLSGVQAMLRVLLEQARADRRVGLKTAGLISGYPGSPLGGVDLEMARNRAIFEAADVHHQLGLNEELAATAIYGTQLIHEVPGAKFDGVFGMWFGKSPGVDRAADAFHHANFHGVGRNGGVLAVAGDDPHARSTILPSDSNTIFASFYMPVLAPGNVQEVLDFGRHGYALSRAAGLWVGFKLVSDIADSAATVEVGPDRVQPVLPVVQFDGHPLEPILRPNEAGPPMIAREREVYYGRLEIARQYARLNQLNRVVAAVPAARRGIAVSGKTYYDLREALHSLGLDELELNRAGIRILKMGMLYPFDHETALEFAQGLEDVLIIEDKRPLLEEAFKAALYGRPNAPRIVGKRDAGGELLLTACGELSSDTIRAALVRWFGGSVGLAAGAALPHAAPRFDPLPEARTAYFCSGCPHNRALRVPEGSVVGAGIGCHIMTLWMGPVFGDVVSYTQMGAEGAQWVGLSRFTETRHFFQNLGDGTLAHSGSLAIRFAVAANINVTYKILYNSAVAMTGGQAVFGGKSVQRLVDEFAAEGVRSIVITTDEVERYKGVRLADIASVRHRDELVAVERELASINGVTVVINDQQCAAEKRRLRKRGRLEQPSTRVLINERICEGCGDCGAKSNCLSVEPVETEFGRKTRINQSSCNQDYSCLLGDCPSFMTIEGGANPQIAVVEPPETIPAPVARVRTDEFSVFMAGIGGTGVITVNQVLGMAAALAGRSVRSIDQIGSSQKAGPVVSHLRIAEKGREGAARIMAGAADLYLAFDLLCGSESQNLVLASPDRTTLVASTDPVPTGNTVTNVARHYPEFESLRERVSSVTKPDRVWIDALAMSRRLFGNEAAANIMLVGAAYQAGALPLPEAAINAAIRLNGVAVDLNLRAFRWGRYAAYAPDDCRRLLEQSSAPAAKCGPLDPSLAAALGRLQVSEPLSRRIEMRAAELVAFQGVSYATKYLDFVAATRSDEVRVLEAGESITAAVAVNLYKLMAYKDEYEVARLMVDAYDRGIRSGELKGSRGVHWLVHPTFLRVLGVRQKVSLGRWFLPLARVLAHMKMLRGTVADPFGRTRVRRLERALVEQYRSTIADAIKILDSGNRDTVLALAELPDLVRGYEDIKLRNSELFERQRVLLLAQLAGKRLT